MLTTFRRPVLVAALAGVVAITAFWWMPVVRDSALRTMGRALVTEDPIGPVDAIVTTAAGGGASVLEAAALVHRGIAHRVAVFADPPEAFDLEFKRRGVPYEDHATIALRQLKSLGVESVEQIPKSVSGTEEEARVLPEWSRQRQVRSIVLITTADHSRRLTRVFGRAMGDGRTTIAIRIARYSTFDPERWWQTRDGARTGIVELQKLLLDFVLHPIS